MDLDRAGRDLRAIRRHLGLSQSAVGRRIGASGSTISRIERGRSDGVPVAVLRATARAIDARIDLRVRWQGGDLDRLVSGRHAFLAETMARRLLASGWVVRPEVSFALGGERGVVDLLAWHPATSSLAVIELKTAIVDVGETLGTFDRKRRLARRIAGGLGWSPERLAAVLVLADDTTNRRRLATFRASIRAALPVDGRVVAAWLRAPSGDLRGTLFLPISHEANRRPGPGRRRRP